MAGSGTRAGVPDCAMRVRVWISLVGPELMPVNDTTRGPDPSRTDRLPSGSSVGASLTGVTVNTNVSLPTAPLVSVTVMVMVAEPNALVAGRKVKVRALPVPPVERFAVGRTPGFDEVAVTARSATS